MNWQSVSFDWNQARAFLATVEEGSLSAAARVLGVTQPTLGRQVSALEDALDIVLFERVGKSLILTASGAELAEHVRIMYEAASRVSLTASGQSQAVEGKVSITASDIMSAYILPSAIKKLREIAPKIEIEIIATDDIRDLQRREADIAIRHVRPEQPNLIARLIAEGQANFYAAKTYFDTHERPQSLKALSTHDFIGHGDTPRMIEYLNEFGVSLKQENVKTSAKNGFVVWQMAKQGLGVTGMLDKIGETTRGMERVLPTMDPIIFPVWLVAHRELHTSARIRLVFDFLADFLKEEMG